MFSDSLRDHYSTCPKRAGQNIPETAQKGRKRHACQSVSITPMSSQVVPVSDDSVLTCVHCPLIMIVHDYEATMRWAKPL